MTRLVSRGSFFLLFFFSFFDVKNVKNSKVEVFISIVVVFILMQVSAQTSNG